MTLVQPGEIARALEVEDVGTGQLAKPTREHMRQRCLSALPWTQQGDDRGALEALFDLAQQSVSVHGGIP